MRVTAISPGEDSGIIVQTGAIKKTGAWGKENPFPPLERDKKALFGLRWQRVLACSKQAGQLTKFYKLT
jgi:hypothetical protein